MSRRAVGRGGKRQSPRSRPTWPDCKSTYVHTLSLPIHTPTYPQYQEEILLPLRTPILKSTLAFTLHPL